MLESDGEITSSMCSKHSEPMSEVLSKYEKRKKVDSGTYRYLMDGERVSPKSENMKTVGGYALEYESDGVLQLTCFTEQVGGSFVAFDPETVTRHVCNWWRSPNISSSFASATFSMSLGLTPSTKGVRST